MADIAVSKIYSAFAPPQWECKSKKDKEILHVSPTAEAWEHYFSQYLVQKLLSTFSEV